MTYLNPWVMLCISFLLIYNVSSRSRAAPLDGRTSVASRVQNLRARYDHLTDAIYVQWSYPKVLHDKKQQPRFLVRYRITNRPDDSASFEWNYIRAENELEAKLDLDELRNGDELQTQVRAEHSDEMESEDWSQSLLIAISKRVLIDGFPVDDDDLLPPLDFQAHILGTSMVRLEWTKPNGIMLNSNLYYIVNVKQVTSEEKNIPLLRQQIKVETNSFTMGNLKPGQRYEFTIRSATSPERISSTAAIVEITMPREDEYFEVGNLIISSHFKGNGQGVVNLTWEVPEKMQSKIKAYDVHYTEANDGKWKQLQFDGSHPSVSLTTLKSDTEYLLKIRTILHNNLTTESGLFKFRTPTVVPNPIKKVDVVYSSDINTVRLQWTLEDFLPAFLVAGYDVYISDNPDLPDAQWSYYRLSERKIPGDVSTSDPRSLSLHDLQTGHTYFIRIDVRKRDGEVLRAPNIYKFKTLERSEILERREANTLSFRFLEPGRVHIAWTYPNKIVHSVTGSTVMYTDNISLPPEAWKRIDLNKPQQNSVVLEHLKPNSRYFIRILPQLNHSIYDSNIIDMFEIRTGSENYFQSPYESFTSLSENIHPRMFQQQKQEQRKSMIIKEKEKLILNPCEPDAIKRECARDERCIPTNENPSRGWCISESLRDAIINN